MEDREYAARILAYANAGATIGAAKRHLTEQEQQVLYRALRRSVQVVNRGNATDDDKLPAVACGGSYL